MDFVNYYLTVERKNLEGGKKKSFKGNFVHSDSLNLSYFMIGDVDRLSFTRKSFCFIIYMNSFTLITNGLIPIKRNILLRKSGDL